MLFDVGYDVNNIDPPYQGEKGVVFLAILGVTRMVIWQTRNKGLYDSANFSYRDLILFFRYLLKVKIRWDRKRLDCITFDKGWGYAVSLVIRKGATLESSFPPLLRMETMVRVLQYPNPVSKNSCTPLSPFSSLKCVNGPIT